MAQNKNPYPNDLLQVRLRRNLTQRQVGKLMRRANTSVLSRYEQGDRLPSLRAALMLEIIFRIPVAFLFAGIYQDLRNQIRDEETRFGLHVEQQRLF
jgi:transcriptional regulator with XRE-family HTH domain